MKYPKQPTSEECTENAEIEFDGRKAFAIWYPQIGGYGNHAVIVPDGENGCFDAYVFSDGEFPIYEDDPDPSEPMLLHHCSAEQFIRFGETVLKLSAK